MNLIPDGMAQSGFDIFRGVEVDKINPEDVGEVLTVGNYVITLSKDRTQKAIRKYKDE